MKNVRISPKACLIGIDLGGTSIKAGVVSRTGRILLRKSVPTCTDAGKKVVISRIAAAGIELAAWARSEGLEPVAIGVGSPGQLDSARGVVFFSPNFPDWRNVPLKGEIEKITGIRTFVENDANAAAWGERWAGAGRNVRTFVLYTLGTGIGGGIVLDGRLWRGANGMGGELGHIIVQPNGKKCGCGNLGCVEASSRRGNGSRRRPSVRGRCSRRRWMGTWTPSR
jgi:glucokinase